MRVLGERRGDHRAGILPGRRHRPGQVDDRFEVAGQSPVRLREQIARAGHLAGLLVQPAPLEVQPRVEHRRVVVRGGDGLRDQGDRLVELAAQREVRGELGQRLGTDQDLRGLLAHRRGELRMAGRLVDRRRELGPAGVRIHLLAALERLARIREPVHAREHLDPALPGVRIPGRRLDPGLADGDCLDEVLEHLGDARAPEEDRDQRGALGQVGAQLHDLAVDHAELLRTIRARGQLRKIGRSRNGLRHRRGRWRRRRVLVCVTAAPREEHHRDDQPPHQCGTPRYGNVSGVMSAWTATPSPMSGANVAGLNPKTPADSSE